MLRASAVFASVVAVGCSGADGPKPTPVPEPSPNPSPHPNPDPTPTPTPDPTPPAHADREPEFFPPAWKKVGVGQPISFATTVIDQDLDETRVEVTAMPASATFDALTQTVTWKPTKADLPAGKFALKISQADTPGGAWTRTKDVAFEIAVDAARQPPPVAEPQPAIVETLLTIRDPKRLTVVNMDWPLDRMLLTGAELLRGTLPPEVQAKLGKLDRTALYRSFLAGLAETHGNPRLDPASPQFDEDAFGTPKDWKIVAVRPRVDKKWNEVRVVYQAVRAPEPVFAMFRILPTRESPTLPPEARATNNTIFLELVAKHLLDKDLGPSAALMKDAKAHARAVAAFVKAVVTYEAPKPKCGPPTADCPAPPPWQRAAFVALPTEARMGGGSARNPDGSYRSGDGWAWSVLKPMPTVDGTNQAYVNMPIPGFWTQAVPAPDGKSWVAKCAPKFDPEDPKHAPGYEVLCRKPQNFVDLPGEKDGKVAPAKRDAVNLFVEHKLRDASAHLALEDGRRDHGEENGMTCAQCHIRNFTVRDHADPATTDPSQGAPTALNKPLATLNFQIIPTTTWEAFTLEVMKDQECKAKAHVEKFLGKPSKLTCPLLPAAP